MTNSAKATLFSPRIRLLFAFYVVSCLGILLRLSRGRSITFLELTLNSIASHKATHTTDPSSLILPPPPPHPQAFHVYSPCEQLTATPSWACELLVPPLPSQLKAPINIASVSLIEIGAPVAVAPPEVYRCRHIAVAPKGRWPTYVSCCYRLHLGRRQLLVGC